MNIFTLAFITLITPVLLCGMTSPTNGKNSGEGRKGSAPVRAPQAILVIDEKPAVMKLNVYDKIEKEAPAFQLNADMVRYGDAVLPTFHR